MTPEIRAFEFALGLFSVLIGLSIADVATSLHRLIRRQEMVRWDPLTLLAALFALLMTIGMWFDLWGVRNATSLRSFFFYVALVASFFVLFLIAASSLPDEATGPVDLRSYYAQNRRYFWLLVTLFQLMYVGFGVHFIAGIIEHMPRSLLAAVAAQWGLLVLVPATLALVRSRPVHYVGLTLLFAVDLWHYAPYSIS